MRVRVVSGIEFRSGKESRMEQISRLMHFISLQRSEESRGGEGRCLKIWGRVGLEGFLV